MKKVTYFFVIIIMSCAFVKKSVAQEIYHELNRPQAHFSPKEKWMNDPNGMVYNNGVYHLFFQYYPDSNVWGPMHWGHATSQDLVHWQQQPIALYPDSLGYIFSGSAIVDKDNTSGFGKNGQAPLVAIYTNHDPIGEKEHRNDFQNQSIAYSLDDGKTWIKYDQNPVLKNPGIVDFRDPKVMWYEPGKKWIMTLATKDRITFYSSPNLKNWKKESEYGADAGDHGGTWECPDLFTINNGGKKIWVLLVSVNPHGLNTGSSTEYFLGDFDGNKFTSYSNKTKWLDYGPDNYAGITWSNTQNRKIFLGWMSNWMYALLVPTEQWRNAMTIPRELTIKSVGDEMLVASLPVLEVNKIQSSPIVKENVLVKDSIEIEGESGKPVLPCRINLSLNDEKDFSIILSNDIGEEVTIGYNKATNNYYIDRTKSGKINFQKDFTTKYTAPRFAKTNNMNMSLIIDASSVELFADDGLSVMTEIFFPNEPYNHIHIRSGDNLLIKKMEYISLQSIWE